MGQVEKRLWVKIAAKSILVGINEASKMNKKTDPNDEIPTTDMKRGYFEQEIEM